VASCGVCGNALCSDCIVHTPVGIKCRDCSGVRSVQAADGAHVSATAGPARQPGSRRPWAVALAAAGVVVVAAAGYAVLPRGSGSDTSTRTPLGLAPVTTERASEFVGAGGARITGTLTLPGVPAGQTTVPAVLIVPGLGAIDRNATTGAGAAGEGDMLRSTLNATVTGNVQGPIDPLYQNLSQALADAGIASFRYDRPGTGAAKAPGLKLSFDDEVADARAALDFLGGRQEVGSSPLGVLGHDTGGLVAMRLAATNPRVKAAVFVSTPSRPLGDVLAEDLVRFGGGSSVDQVRTSVAALQATGKAPAPDTLPAGLRELFPAGQESYLRALFSLDPLAEAGAVPVDALVVRGGADQTVTAEDGRRLHDALPKAADVMVGATDADHNLAVAVEGHTHANNGAVPKPGDNRDSALTARLSTWMKSRFSA
jgi:pimeloyl-ACP methyl ester carboxylesterase